MSNNILRIRNLTKRYGSISAIDEVQMALKDHEILTLVGPSGCGKTTALRLIAGLEQPDRGEIVLNGQTVSGNNQFVSPENRNVGLVFQDLALFPHMTVAENVSFGLSSESEQRKNRIKNMIDLVGLHQVEDRYPEELSGGQQQRVALARSLVLRPSVLLMDEPFSNLDKQLRERLRRDVRDILRESETPTIFVTHNQEEAIFMGDRVAVMNEGRIEQIDSPQEITTDPSSRFVADFMGKTDFLTATVENGTVRTEIGDLEDGNVRLPDGHTEVDLMVRADDLTVKSTENANKNGHVIKREFLGGFIRYEIELPSGDHVHALLSHDRQLEIGSSVRVQMDPGHPLTAFPTDTEREKK